MDGSLLSPAISRIMKPKKVKSYKTELSADKEGKNNNGGGESSPNLQNGQVCDVQVHFEESGSGTKM